MFENYISRHGTHFGESFAQVWDKLAGIRAGASTADFMRSFSFSEHETKCLLEAADDDNSGDVARFELVDFLHASTTWSRIADPSPKVYRYEALECWAEVYHNEGRHFNDRLCP